jgi:branched-chain amino acid transport system substrate-binding protein
MRLLILVILLLAAPLIAAGETIRPAAPLKMGLLLPLSGPLAEYGVAIRNGFELAQTEEPTRFSGLSLVYEDHRYEATEAVTSFNKVTNVDKVSIVFNFGEPTLAALAPLAEQGSVPLLAISLDAKPAANRRFTVLTINTAEDFARTLVEHLRSKSVRSIGVIKTDDPFFDAMLAQIQLRLQPGETLKVVASCLPDDADFRSHIIKLRKSAFDAVGVYLLPGQVSSFFKQARGAGLKARFFGTDIFESRTEVEQAGEAMQGAVYPNLQVPSDFVQRYVERFGNNAQISYAYDAYELARYTASLFPQSESPPSREMIVKRYTALGDHHAFSVQKSTEGVTYFKYPLIMRQVQGNDFKDVR